MSKEMLKEKLKDYKIILASGSPRRQQFFKDLDIDFEIRIKEVEEVFPKHLKGAEISDYLAELKARVFDGTLNPNEILITSDTIVWLNDKALGKPKDYNDAFQILKSLSDTSHEVITSICFKTADSLQIVHDITKVTFNKLSEEAINYYIENYKPYDKAGAYGIQEWIGLIGISKIEGSYTNVVGLPTELIYNYFNKL
jgi:septum formation protein